MLNSALVFSAKTDIRFYICGVNIYHKDGQIKAMASTNGHAMQLLTCEDVAASDIGSCESFIVSNEDCKRLTYILNKESIDDVTPESILQFIKPIDARYPDITRVIPSDSDRVAIDSLAVNFKYLSLIDKSMTKLCKARIPLANVGLYGKNKAIVFDITCAEQLGVSVKVVMMPMKGE